MKRTAAIITTALVFLGLVATGVTAAGCGGVPSDAVATVGDTSITKTQFNELLNQAKAQFESQGMTFPEAGTSTYKSYVAMIVEYLVQSEIVAQNASDYDVSVTDEEVEEQVAQIEETYGGAKKVKKILKQQGMTMELLKQSIKDQTMTQEVSAKVIKEATVSDADIQAYWDEHKAELSKKKKTATLAKAKATIRSTLLEQAQEDLWADWLTEKADDLGVEYASGYAPEELTASPSASATSGS